MPNEVGSVEEGVIGSIVIFRVGWKIPSEGENVADANGCVAFECSVDLFFAVCNASEMGDRGSVGGFFNSDHEIVSEFSGGAAGSVGDADKRWVVG